MSIEIDLESVYVGGFIECEATNDGRLHVLLFGILPASDKLEIVNTIEYSPDCIQHFLQDDTALVVGSLFEVRRSVALVKPNVLHVSSNKDPLDYMASPVSSDVGHTCIYSDEVENIVIIPSSPVSSNLCVDVEDDKSAKGT